VLCDDREGECDCQEAEDEECEPEPVLSFAKACAAFQTMKKFF
jgi:hypothetical protein